jgi:hypothetical protein
MCAGAREARRAAEGSTARRPLSTSSVTAGAVVISVSLLLPPVATRFAADNGGSSDFRGFGEAVDLQLATFLA